MTNKNITIDSLDKPNPLPTNNKKPVIRHNLLAEPYFVLLVMVLTFVFIAALYFIYQALDYQSLFAIDIATRILATLGKWIIISAPIILLGYGVMALGQMLLNAASKVGLTSFSEHQTSIQQIKNKDARQEYFNVALEDAKQSKLRNVTNYSPSNASTNNNNAADIIEESKPEGLLDFDEMLALMNK